MKRIVLIAALLSFSVAPAQKPMLKSADSLLQHGNYQAALHIFEKIRPQSSDVLVKQAGIYQRTGNYAKAIKLYEKVLQTDYSPRIVQELGKTYLAQGDLKKAIKIYEGVLEKDSLNLLLMYDLSKLYTKDRKSDKAILLLKKLITADSLNPNYYYRLGKIYHNQSAKGFLKAGDQYLKAYRIDSTHLNSIYELVKFYKQLRFKDSVSIYINKGLRLNPDNINFLQFKVKDLYLKKDFDNALVYLKKLEENGFKTAFTYTYFGMVYLKKEEFEKAKTYFKKALRLNREDPTILYYMGLTEKGTGDLRKAKFYFIMSIAAQKPDIDKQYFELGMIALEQKQTAEAIRIFKKSYENNHKNYHSLFELAMASEVYYKDKKIALKYYEEFVERFSKKDKQLTKYAQDKIKVLKKELFLKAEN